MRFLTAAFLSIVDRRRGKDAREMTSLPVGSTSAAVVVVVLVVVLVVVNA